ncbi:MAG: PilZ domain-containing protein [Chloroflexota bacterium]
MSDSIRVGDRVQVFLEAKTWGTEGWFDGTVVRIDPYTEHRSFHWVELDAEAQAMLGRGVRLISVLNPKHIRKLGSEASSSRVSDPDE